MVPDNIGQAEHAPFLSDSGEKLSDLLLFFISEHLVSINEERVVKGYLVPDGVRTVAFASRLERSEVDHVVPSIPHYVEVIVPLVDRTHPFCNDSLHNDTTWR